MTGLCQTELNNEMLRHRFAINNAGSSAQGSRFSEICGEKRGWRLKPRHFLAVEGIFLFPVFLRRKWIFGIFQGVYKDFGGCSVKGRQQGKQTPTSNRMENQACRRLKIGFAHRSLAHAQTLFSSVIFSLIDRQHMQSRYPNTTYHRRACSERSILAGCATISRAKFCRKI